MSHGATVRLITAGLSVVAHTVTVMAIPSILTGHPRMIVADVETTGLCPFTHQATEVAWWDSATDEYGELVLPHTLDQADPMALEVQRYDERGVADLPHATPSQVKDLWTLFGGETEDRAAKPILVGSNAGFDAAMLGGTFHRAGLAPSQPWYYRPLDVASIAQWGLGWVDDNGHPLKLFRLAERLDVTVPDNAAHTAIGDVRTTVQVLTRLLERLPTPDVTTALA